MDPDFANLLGVISSGIGIIATVCGFLAYIFTRKERDLKVIIGGIITTVILAILALNFAYKTPGIAKVLPDNPIFKKVEVSPGPLSPGSMNTTLLPGSTNTQTLATPSPPPPIKNGMTFSAPSIFVRSTGEADIVAQGPNNFLWYHWAFPGKNWLHASI